VNSAVADALGIDVDYAKRHLARYTRRLAERGKYELTIWPRKVAHIRCRRGGRAGQEPLLGVDD
jgi:hypothetical protein